MAEVRPFFTPKTLAEYLDLSERTVYDLLKRGKMPSYKVGGARRIASEDVERYLAGCRQERAA